MRERGARLLRASFGVTPCQILIAAAFALESQCSE